jgi:putative nucleotidyltransferase with HDIG domain
VNWWRVGLRGVNDPFCQRFFTAILLDMRSCFQHDVIKLSIFYGFGQVEDRPVHPAKIRRDSPDQGVDKETGMKILIVDDAAVNLYILETLLKGSGYEVASAGDGLKALDQLRGNSCDLIISDILMPRMDGFQLCRECRSDPALREIPFVFYTATYTESKDREFALGLGADRFIVKPMEPNEFLKVISEAIAGKRQDGEAALCTPDEEEKVYLKEYNERLVGKLEKKMLDLQKLNRALQESEAKYRKNYVTQRIINSLLHVSLEEISLEGILEKTIDLILTLPWLVRESKGCIYLVEDEPEVLVMKVQKGLDESIRAKCARLPFGECICGRAARTLTVEFAAPSDERHKTTVREMSPHGHYCVPILYAGRSLGVLNVHLPEGYQWDRQEEESLVAVADTLAGIIIRKRAEKERSESIEKLRSALEATIQAMALTVEVRDPCTSGHQHRVANLARAIAEEIGMGRDSVEGIHTAGLIHDLGKISVPAEILSKPTKLTKIEFDLIKIHSQAGYDILKEIEFPWPVAKVIYQHHERLDGSGYPAGLKGAEICREAQILAVADVVEAIASHRPYRPAKSIDLALGEIAKSRAVLYAPEVVDACLRLFREKEFRFE